MDLETIEIPVKIQWGKQKLDFNMDLNDDIDTFQGIQYNVNQ